MTSPISSYLAGQGLPDTVGSPVSASVALQPQADTAAGATASSAAAADETVTLTPDARTSTDLLEAARAASGIDNQAVQVLKATIMTEAYQVPPDQLAASIVAALAEIRS